jgi:hypothetical protein
MVQQYHMNTPDNPSSLFQGFAGTALFYLSLLRPLDVRFPAFEF